MIGADGSNFQELIDAAIAGLALPRPLPWLHALNGPWHAVFLATNLLSGTSSPYSGATLHAYEGTTRNALTTYGALPTGALAGLFQSSWMIQWGGPGLFSAIGGSGTSDLYFVGGTSPGLTRVTNFIP
jgi:hypothetical protein